MTDSISVPESTADLLRFLVAKHDWLHERRNELIRKGETGGAYDYVVNELTMTGYALAGAVKGVVGKDGN